MPVVFQPVESAHAHTKTMGDRARRGWWTQGQDARPAMEGCQSAGMPQGGACARSAEVAEVQQGPSRASDW